MFQEFLQFAKEILAYLVDLLDPTVSETCDEGIVQAYQKIGWSLVASRESSGHTNAPLQVLADQVTSKLTAFNTQSESLSGLAMEQLWSFFKPPTISNKHQFEMYIEIEALADRFDAIKWSSGASIYDLSALRDTLIAVNISLCHHETHAVTIPDKAKSLLQDAETQTPYLIDNTGPYFQAQFEMLKQFQFIDNMNEVEAGRRILGLLADRPTKTSMAIEAPGLGLGWQTLSQVHLLPRESHQGHNAAIYHQTFLISAIRQLVELEEVPLSGLKLLTDEIQVLSTLTTQMCGIIGTDILASLDGKLVELRTMVFRALSPDQTGGQVQALPDRSTLSKHLKDLGVLKQETTSNATLRALLECSLQILHFDSSKPAGLCNKTVLQLAIDWTKFYAGLLFLYVPDRPLDPALRPSLELARYRKRIAEMQSRLDALETFQLSFSGQKSSYRIQLVQEDLRSLGPEPQILKIHRPEGSKLLLLQSELNNIMKSITFRIPNVYLSDAPQKANENLTKELEVLRGNIKSASIRLADDFREYDDITKPILAMLQGLDIGLNLAVIANAQSSGKTRAIAYVCDMTPFMGANPQTMLAHSFHDLEKMSLSGLDLRPLFLGNFALVQSIDVDSAKKSRYTMLECFHSFYREWKEKLSQEQREKAAESSLYKYRNMQDDIEGFNTEDLSQIFQSHDGPGDKPVSQALPHDPKAIALRVSQLHYEIFQPDGTATNKILRMIDTVSNQISTLWSHEEQACHFPIATEKLLPALIQNLSNARDSLQHSHDRKEMYNFYKDSNVVEAKKVVAIVRDIQTRFHELQRAWPEHATLEDVLKTSKELLSFEYSVPVAKMLTKVEQLHSYMHEWQVVASRQFTANGLFDQVTNLLISWRRLELSTWGQLLDMEDKLCNDDSDSWWFIAYEVIIAAPMSLMNEAKDASVYALQLYTALEKFLETTSKGQYLHRLNLIKCFEDHLALLAEEHEPLQLIRSALSNFLRFYHHFDEPIQRTLKENRKSLERELKEVLLLASWKDTNILALRDSAKRSHHKLFKIVRKYRSLLAQPANDSFQFEIREGVGELDGVSSSDIHSSVTNSDPQALEFCVTNWKGWNEQPARLRKPNETAQTMLHLSHYPANVVDAALHLEILVSDLAENMMLLRKETPSKLTLHNKVAIKHLKTRKKKLFSDTLKAVRQMGFRNNINSDIIKKQETTAAVLSNSPSFGHAGLSELAQAENYFDRFVSIMPQIREKALKHSDDLTHGDVTKSIGYLESMLCTILKQRNLLARSAGDLINLKDTCRGLKNMWAPERYCIRQKGIPAEKHETSLYRQIQWLSNMIDVGCIISETQGRLSQSDSGEVLSYLNSYKTKISKIQAEVASLPELPQGISSTAHLEVFTRYQATAKEFQSQLKHKEAEYPNLAFVFVQIGKWTTFNEVDRDYDSKEPDTLLFSLFANSILDAVNSVLVAVQRMREALDSTSIATEDTRWLLEVDKVLANGLEKLQGGNIDNILGSVISQIPHLDVSESQDIKLTSALCAVILPIVGQYESTLQKAFLRYAKLHVSLCRVASVMANTFRQLIEEGFCSPKEDSRSAQEGDEKLEGGMGLGEGEGAEDISKDIEDDEDLTDLAQKGEKDDSEQKKDIEDQDDAVNMNQDEMAGESGDAAENGSEDNDSQEGDDNEIDDEIGSVDDLDPGTVDEKLWDGKGRDDGKDKEDTNSRNKGEEDQANAAENATMEVDDSQSQTEKNSEEGDVHQDDVADEADEVAHEEIGNMDPRTQKEQNLDLPEGMDLDIEEGLDDPQSEEDESTELSNDNGEEEFGDNADNMEDDPSADSLQNHDVDDLEIEQVEDHQTIENAQKDHSEATSPADTTLDDQTNESEKNLENKFQDHVEETPLDVDAVVAPSETQGLGQDLDQTQAIDQVEDGSAQTRKGAESAFDEPNNMQAGAGDGKKSELLAENERQPTQNEGQEEPPDQALKKLGDALEKFHRQLRHIQDASDTARDNTTSSEAKNEDFEHLGLEDQDDGTQALGPTSSELAKPLHDEDAESDLEEPRTYNPHLSDKEIGPDEDQVMDDKGDPETTLQNLEERNQVGAFVGEHSRPEHPIHQPNANIAPDVDESMKGMEEDHSLDVPQPPLLQEDSRSSFADALELWSYYEAITQDLSLFLTEQLRLILTPTQATKMRGDFRTGKRLNIKRIIPYIASNFKQDKIWMRRSFPSKRNYQILLALDDSRSMSENGSGQLAYQTLAVMTKSLSVLEVGEICIVGFGNHVFVAHDFNIPFTSEAGANVLQRFNFQQDGTNVANLIDRSIAMLQEARLKQTKSSQDLLQLELIISDGLCEDHEKIKRLVRQAMEERIMIVFVIVDALLQNNSIVDMTQAVFEDDAIHGKTGVKIKRYLDDFPFTYYLVVGDVKDLPRVLAQALRQWFAEVVGN